MILLAFNPEEYMVYSSRYSSFSPGVRQVIFPSDQLCAGEPEWPPPKRGWGERRANGRPPPTPERAQEEAVRARDANVGDMRCSSVLCERGVAPRHRCADPLGKRVPMTKVALIRGHPADVSGEPSLLATKFHIPHTAPTLVARPHLTQCINEGVQKKLTLLCAPAGFGKTSLLAEWCAGRTRHSDSPAALLAWVSLDAGENDPEQFWCYVLVALHRLAPPIGEEALLLLQSPEPPAME